MGLASHTIESPDQECSRESHSTCSPQTPESHHCSCTYALIPDGAEDLSCLPIHSLLM